MMGGGSDDDDDDERCYGDRDGFDDELMGVSGGMQNGLRDLRIVMLG